MISLRQHAISIAAIFLALAVGVVLGSQTLASSVLGGLRDDKSDLQRQVDDLEGANNALRLQLQAADNFDAATGGRVVKDALAKRTVVVFTTPDADSADVQGVTDLVAAAGGSVTGRIGLTDAFLDVANADRLRTTVTNVVPAGAQLKTGAVDQGSLSGDLVGLVSLLNALDAKPQGSPEEIALALGSLRNAGFLTYDDGFAPAQLAVVVTGDARDGNRSAIVARFAAALDGRSAGAVLAGRPAAAEGNGPIAVARADAGLAAAASTVDNIDRQFGRMTVILALAEQLSGGSGRYGTGPKASAITVGARPS